jgi:hypothetical protein
MLTEKLCNKCRIIAGLKLSVLKIQFHLQKSLATETDQAVGVAFIYDDKVLGMTANHTNANSNE